jgi:hypothetical protein
MVAVGWNISPAHAAGLSPALLLWAGTSAQPMRLGQYRPSPVHFKKKICVLFVLKIVIFPRIFRRHFD